MKIRKRQIALEAFRFGIDAVPDWFQSMINEQNAYYYDDDIAMGMAMVKVIRDKQIFWLEVERGQVVVKDVCGLVYPVDPSVFALMFEVMER